MNTRILIAEEYEMIRAGMRSVLERIDDVEVIGEAADVTSAARLCRQEAPDILMLDAAIPLLGEVEHLRDELAERADFRVILCAVDCDQQAVAQAFRSGANGYLLKDGPASEIAVALRAVKHGDVYLSPRAAEALAKGYLRSASSNHQPSGQLSGREREVLQQLADGRTNREIGESLRISVKTVEAHRAKLMEKLRLHSVPELTKYAIREGLTSVKI
jgi:DNA-binding NarL/FixJ family response regulator